MRYAQIYENGVCFSISNLSGEVDSFDMILLGEDEIVNLGDTYTDGVWTPAPPVEPPIPEESIEDKVADLETENVNLMLALTEIYEQKEAEKAAMEQENINTMLALTELYEQMLTMQNGGTT